MLAFGEEQDDETSSDNSDQKALCLSPDEKKGFFFAKMKLSVFDARDCRSYEDGTDHMLDGPSFQISLTQGYEIDYFSTCLLLIDKHRKSPLLYTDVVE